MLIIPLNSKNYVCKKKKMQYLLQVHVVKVFHSSSPWYSGRNQRSVLSYLVLSEIHSSLTSSFSLGITLITSPPRVLTTMLLPTASSTSMDSVFLWPGGADDEKGWRLIGGVELCISWAMVVRFCLPGLPRSRSESVRLGRERPHGADVDDVARELRHEHFLHVGADLQVVASTGGAQVLHPGDLAGKAEQTKPQLWPCSATMENQSWGEGGFYRTQRVHWMQRVIMVLISGPMFLSSTALLPSVKRLRSEPNCMDWSWRRRAASVWQWRLREQNCLMKMQKWLDGKHSTIFSCRVSTLPAGHTLLPDRRWDSLVGDWPGGTPSLPPWVRRCTHKIIHLKMHKHSFFIQNEKKNDVCLLTWLYVFFLSWWGCSSPSWQAWHTQPQANNTHTRKL